MIDKEKVRELASLAITQAILNLNKTAEDAICSTIVPIQKWLEQNQPEPVVVGLSDEQMEDLCFQVANVTKNTHWNIEGFIKKWFEKQTFTQPQQLKPSWDDAPDWANWLAQDFNGSWNWFEEKPEIVSSISTKFKTTKLTVACFDNTNWQQTLEQRPTPPAPKVEVGQVWRCLSNNQDYRIHEIDVLEGETKINGGEWQKDMQLVAYRPVKACEVKIYHRTLEDFLAKFELVGG